MARKLAIEIFFLKFNKDVVIVKKSSPKNLSADCRSIVGRQTADRFCPKYRLPVGRQWADSRPTVGNVSVTCR